MRYSLFAAVLVFLGCGSTPCAPSDPLAPAPDQQDKHLAEPTPPRALYLSDPIMRGRAKAIFVTFSSMPACTWPCKRAATHAGADLLSDPQEDPRAWVTQPGNGSSLIPLPFSQPADRRAPGLSTFWQDPEHDEFYLEFGAMAFSRAETGVGPITAGIKFVRPLR